MGGGSGAGSSSVGSLDTLDTDDSWQQQLEEIGDKLNAENDRTGFLRMVNRNHIFNCSNYSLSSLFSLSAGLNGINPSITNMRNAMKSKQRDKSPIAALYELLVAPMEESLQAVMDGTENRNLVCISLFCFCLVIKYFKRKKNCDLSILSACDFFFFNLL